VHGCAIVAARKDRGRTRILHRAAVLPKRSFSSGAVRNRPCALPFMRRSGYEISIGQYRVRIKSSLILYLPRCGFLSNAVIFIVCLSSAKRGGDCTYEYRGMNRLIA
jgi:hypothetical protein